MGQKQSFSDTYRDRTVLITGHSGFKGAWLSTWLTLLGSRVFGLSLPSEDLNSISATFDAPVVESAAGDVGSRLFVQAAFDRFRPDLVFHLAAQSLVQRSYKHPVETFLTNVMGTVHVLEAARSTPSVKAVVVATSDKCYENNDTGIPFTENMPLGGHDPYSASKACAEIVTAAYRSSFHQKAGQLVATVRAGNVIGGGDQAENRLIPDIVRAILHKQPVRLRNPESVRPWQHVLDPLYGYLLVGQELLNANGAVARAWNFGPTGQRTLSVLDVANLFLRFNTDTRIEIAQEPNAGKEASSLYIDATQAMSELNWQPHLDVSSAIEWTAEWYRKFYFDGSDGRVLTERQIEAYMSLQRDRAGVSR